MNNSTLHIRELEANLQRLRERVPDLPVSGVLLSRMLMHLGRGMASLFEQQIRPFGLAEAEFRVLTTLFSQPEGIAHPGELCSRTSQSPANMSRISDALVSRDLITRGASAHDRRKMVLRITEQGEDLVRRLMPKMIGPMREMFGDFSEQELSVLVAQLKRLGLKMETVTAQSAERSL